MSSATPRRFEPKRDAALRTMEEVGGALVSIALVLCAVFVPTAFLGGISGQFFQPIRDHDRGGNRHFVLLFPDTVAGIGAQILDGA